MQNCYDANNDIMHSASEATLGSLKLSVSFSISVFISPIEILRPLSLYYLYKHPIVSDILEQLLEYTINIRTNTTMFAYHLCFHLNVTVKIQGLSCDDSQNVPNDFLSRKRMLAYLDILLR